MGWELGSRYPRIAAMIQNIEPLDVIVWRGHVMVALDQERVIQSRLAYPDMPGEKGVKIQSLRFVLAELLKEKKAVNDYASFPDQQRFVIRRWVK